MNCGQEAKKKRTALNFIAYFQLPNVACKEVCEITSVAVKALRRDASRSYFQ